MKTNLLLFNYLLTISDSIALMLQLFLHYGVTNNIRLQSLKIIIIRRENQTYLFVFQIQFSENNSFPHNR